jgi:hypothetical protein
MTKEEVIQIIVNRKKIWEDLYWASKQDNIMMSSNYKAMWQEYEALLRAVSV